MCLFFVFSLRRNTFHYNKMPLKYCICIAVPNLIKLSYDENCVSVIYWKAYFNHINDNECHEKLHAFYAIIFLFLPYSNFN